MTRDEARVLRAANVHEGSYLYEIASAAQLTPAEAGRAVERLAGRGYVAPDAGPDLVRLTRAGLKARHDISRLYLDDSKIWSGRSHIVDDGNREWIAAHLGPGAAEPDLAAAISLELGKYE